MRARRVGKDNAMYGALVTVENYDRNALAFGCHLTQITPDEATLVVRRKHLKDETVIFSRRDDGMVIADDAVDGVEFWKVSQEVVARMEMMRLAVQLDSRGPVGTESRERKKFNQGLRLIAEAHGAPVVVTL